MKFTKMQGCGNDYIYINGMEEIIENKKETVIALSDRHFGIGGDGVIFINSSEIADFEMEMYNADGSRSQMCGNGIRCVGKYVYDHHLTDKTEITVESFGSIKYLKLNVSDGFVDTVNVDMGEPELISERIPVICEKEKTIMEPIDVSGRTFYMTCVSMGNPHAVFFTDEITDELVLKWGKTIECHPRFPERVNAEFVTVKDRGHVNMRVWERGTGETLACGTGCCATAVACVLNNLTDETVEVTVPGGKILIEWNKANNHIYMTGPAVTVFEGEI